jgi:hypothetical protein
VEEWQNFLTSDDGRAQSLWRCNSFRSGVVSTGQKMLPESGLGKR